MRKFAYVAVAIGAALLLVAPASASAQANDSSAIAVLGLNDKKQNAVKPSEEKDQSQVKSDGSDQTSTPAAPTAPAPVMVTVQPGDSLAKIAAAYGTTWVRLYDANSSITDPNIINPGDQIRVPDPSEQLASRPLPQPAPVKTVQVATTTTSTRPSAAPAASYPVSANGAKAFIYAHESGNNPNATNPHGCYGLGQDCNGVVRHACGADYACQDAYFTSYAMRRYGSWENALAFWQSHHWW